MTIERLVKLRPEDQAEHRSIVGDNFPPATSVAYDLAVGTVYFTDEFTLEDGAAVHFEFCVRHNIIRTITRHHAANAQDALEHSGCNWRESM